MTQLSPFEFAIARLVDLGWTREQAERAVRKDLPSLAPPMTSMARDESVLEKAEQVEIRKVAIAYGFRPRNLSQPRASKQSPGFGDLWLVHRRLPIAFWWETKRQIGGRLSPDQEEFRDDCLRTNTGYGCGDRYAFAEKLIDLELAVRGDGPLGIVPVRDAIGAAP